MCEASERKSPQPQKPEGLQEVYLPSGNRSGFRIRTDLRKDPEESLLLFHRHKPESGILFLRPPLQECGHNDHGLKELQQASPAFPLFWKRFPVHDPPDPRSEAPLCFCFSADSSWLIQNQERMSEALNFSYRSPLSLSLYFYD